MDCDERRTPKGTLGEKNPGAEDAPRRHTVTSASSGSAEEWTRDPYRDEGGEG
jgi:hypothetical protein